MLLSALGASMLIVPAFAQATNSVPVLQLDGVVDPFVADYIEGAIDRAASGDAPAVMIEIDTPGGLDSSMRQITQSDAERLGAR